MFTPSNHQSLQIATSPIIETFRENLAIIADQEAFISDFWREIERTHTPLFEPVTDHPDWQIVTFLWRASQPLQQALVLVHTLTDRNRHDLTSAFMRHIEGTNIWHISYYIRAQLRTSYQIVPVTCDQPAITTHAHDRQAWLDVLQYAVHDPFNPHTFPSLRSDEPNSVLEMPQAPPHDWWQERDHLIKGTLTHHQLLSDIMGNERQISIYTPPNYSPDHPPYPVLVLLDGMAWVHLASIEHTLNNLINAGEIAPLIAIMVDSIDGQTRMNEMACQPEFIQFLNDELFTWASERWNLTSNPQQTIIAGQSFGGLAASYAGFYAPHRFGKVLAQSSSYWWKDGGRFNPDTEWLTRQFALSKRLPIQFYVSIGREEWQLLAVNRRFRDVLIAKGYDLHYHEYHGAHDYLCWRGGIVDGLLALTHDNYHGDSSVTPIGYLQVTRESTIPPQLPMTNPPEVIQSARIQQVKLALDAGQTNALNQFWADVHQTGTPLIEALDDGYYAVTFLWRDDGDTEGVLVLANKTTDASVHQASMMERLPQSDIWHRTYRLRGDWRSSYQLGILRLSTPAQPDDPRFAWRVERMLAVGSSVAPETLAIWANAQAVMDPLNLQPFNEQSIVELPDAPPQRWYHARPNVPQGTITQHQFTSGILDNTRQIWVYTPSGYSPDAKPYPVMVLLDGDNWIHEHPIQATLDNLIHEGQIPPLVVVMPEPIDMMTRIRELSCNPLFVQFLTDELLPWASQTWHITDNPQYTILSGLSLGGLTSAFAGLHAPQRFGNILSQSGSFWWANDAAFEGNTEWISRQYAVSPRLPLNFYLEIGLAEWTLLPQTRHLRNVLDAKGYDLTYVEFNGGHDTACFKGGIAEGLIALTGKWDIQP